MIKQELLKVLACPFCKTGVRLENNLLLCTNPECGCQYAIEDDIPIMLIDRAKRPCPQCNTQRDWVEEKDLIACPKCQAKIKYKPQT